MRFATPQGFNSGDQFYTYLKDSFDTLYAEGDVAPKMLSVGLHCRLVGRPGRAASLARFLDYVLAHDKAWVPTRLDIARHWIGKHPPPGGWKPTKLTRTLFVERFGGVYEHSPWIAAAAYDAGLPADADTAEGLARSVCRPRRRKGSDEQETRADPRPSRSRRAPCAGEAPHGGIDRRAGERRPRPAEPRRAREVHRSQRRLSRPLRHSLHHGGQGQEQGRHPRRLRAPARERRGRRDADGARPRSTASRRCASRTSWRERRRSASSADAS